MTDKNKTLRPKNAALTWLFVALRTPVFLVLYWLRLPVVFLCNIVSIPMLFAWLFSLYAFPDKVAMIWGFGLMSFTAFVIAWTYDYVLMLLSPMDMIQSL